LEFSGEIDILDQDTLDADSPCGSNLCDNLLDALSDFFTSFNDVLEDTCTKDMTKGRLGTLHESGTHAANAEGCFVGIDDVVVDDRCDVHVDIIFGHTNLSGNFNDGDLDIDLLYFLAQRIDFSETWIDCTAVLSEFQDETGLTFVDLLIGIRTTDATWDGSKSSAQTSQTIDHFAVPSHICGIFRHSVCERRLEV
jgi:hypothetical protein